MDKQPQSRPAERLTKCIYLLFATSLVLGGHAHAEANDLLLTNTPLYIVNPVEPNIMLHLDGSYSMQGSIVADLADAYIAENNNGIYRVPKTPNDREGAPYNFYSEVIPAANNNTDRTLLDDKCPSTVPPEYVRPGYGLWRVRSWDFNTLYYNPATTYEPWVGEDLDGNPLYFDSTPTAARIEPEGRRLTGIPDTYATTDLTNDITCQVLPTTQREEATFFPAMYNVWEDSDRDGVVDVDDGFTRVEIKPGNQPFDTNGGVREDCADKTSCTYGEEIQNFANWYTYYRDRGFAAMAAFGGVVNRTEDARLGLWIFQDHLQLAPASMSNATNKYNLLTKLYNVGLTTLTPTRSSLIALGEYFKNSPDNEWEPIQSEAEGGECQQNFSVMLTDGYWACRRGEDNELRCYTPNQYVNGPPLKGDEEEFSERTEPDSQVLEDNDTDGNTEFDGGVYADPKEKKGGPPKEQPSLADIAMYYYENDLVEELGNHVPTIAGVDEASHQHLVNYVVSLGVSGTLDPTGTKTPDDETDTNPNAAGFVWPIVIQDDPTVIDDLWHAAFNSRGGYISTLDAAKIGETLLQVFAEIDNLTSSSSSVALSSGSISSSSLLFQARFDSEDWDGQLLAFSIEYEGSSTGAIGNVQWDASCVLTGGTCPATTDTSSSSGQNWNDGREIITSTPPGVGDNGTGVAFRWSSLTEQQTNALRTDPDEETVGTEDTGRSILEFVRGNNDIEGLRVRDNLLGDIVDSSPVYVGAPNAPYLDSLEDAPYSTFASNHANRTPMVYVGANDGMLHGIQATSGVAGSGMERIAYVPSQVYANLPFLADPDYPARQHKYFVNASPQSGDVYINGSWRTILVGGLGLGGQGLYALDVTDPSRFDEANARSLVLWEFTDVSDNDDNNSHDVGYVYGRPEIVRLGNSRWGVVFGNGFNSTEADGAASSTGNAVIFIVDAGSGEVVAKFDTGVGYEDDPSGQSRPNGIKEILVADVDVDRTADYIYAGDLFGNLWKVDIRGSDSSDWDFALRSGSTPVPLFVAETADGEDVSITSKVDVGLHPAYYGQMVYFGTGKYLEKQADIVSDQVTQSFYGIWDKNQSGSGTEFGREHLLTQEIYEEQDIGTALVRLVTDNPIQWYGPTSGTPSDPETEGYLGWVIDMPTEGERIVGTPELYDGRILFNTIIPSADICSAGGLSWFMQLDAATGGAPTITPFDLNGDGLFDQNDTVTDSEGNLANAAGTASDTGLSPESTRINSDGERIRYDTGTSGDVRGPSERDGTADEDSDNLELRSAASVGRQSWRQIK